VMLRSVWSASSRHVEAAPAPLALVSTGRRHDFADRVVAPGASPIAEGARDLKSWLAYAVVPVVTWLCALSLVARSYA
jgi:hypothetical protein